MRLSVEPETREEELARLRLELGHAGEQCQVAHARAMRWRQRALTAEEHCRRLQKKVDRLRGKGPARSATQATGDGLHDRLGLLDQAVEDAEDAPVSV
jgi:hypothetical protein